MKVLSTRLSIPPAMSENNKSLFVYKLARFGAVSIGIVYILIGVVAILSLLRIKDGGADEKGILNFIDNMPAGKVLLALLFLGLSSYIAWKFYNAFKDPYGYGKSIKGLATRTGLVGGAIAYCMIGYTAIQALLGLTRETNGQPESQRLLIGRIFEWWGGEWIIGALGVVVAVTGLSQFYYVISQGYREKLDKGIDKTWRWFVASLAWIGHFARGIILLIISWFLIKAAIQSQPSEMVNTDKAFNFLGENIGHFWFVLVASGTICYGLYMLALSYFYDFENDIK